jgi:RNA polymerase-binding transcription factor
MKAKQRSQTRTALLARKQQLEAELGHMRSELLELSIDQEDERGGVGNHFADDGSSLGEQERISIIGDDFQEQIRQIDAALSRLDDGTYGICRRCGNPIAPERLEALPFVAYCINCQAYLERQNALYGGAANLKTG